MKIYVDDARIPTDKDWVLVKNFNEFVDIYNKHKNEIEIVSLDHDLASEHYVSSEYWYDYEKSKKYQESLVHTEKTGYDIAKYIVEQWLKGDKVFQVFIHSYNPVGSANIFGYMNNFYMLYNHNFICDWREQPYIT